MATKSKRVGAKKKTTAKGSESSNKPAYVRLRTVLDSLEFGAVRYFLGTPSPNQRQRLEKLEAQLLPIIDWLYQDGQGLRSTQEPASVIDCPDGYINCHGVCVPYACPD
jgi:hypothetical protein